MDIITSPAYVWNALKSLCIFSQTHLSFNWKLALLVFCVIFGVFCFIKAKKEVDPFDEDSHVVFNITALFNFISIFGFASCLCFADYVDYNLTSRFTRIFAWIFFVFLWLSIIYFIIIGFKLNIKYFLYCCCVIICTVLSAAIISTILGGLVLILLIIGGGLVGGGGSYIGTFRDKYGNSYDIFEK